jgi:hypothetical protein
MKLVHHKRDYMIDLKDEEDVDLVQIFKLRILPLKNLLNLIRLS